MKGGYNRKVRSVLKEKGGQTIKLVSGTVLGLVILVFLVFGGLFGIATLNPSSFFTANSAEANATANLQANLTEGVSNFGAKLPSVFTIFGVLLIIAGIVLLVFYIRRMESSGGSGGAGL